MPDSSETPSTRMTPSNPLGVFPHSTRGEGEAANPQRGRLKVYLGYAAGVGKTSAMLSAARDRAEAGVDVAVGVVNTHNRPEMEALLSDLPQIPLRKILSPERVQTEMDLDAVLNRRPALVLVDELAHANLPGSRHPRRYQDVLDLLEAGLDVYTTLNIQQLESLGDVVQQITGGIVVDALPDFVLDGADEIELVDLPPDELLERLRDGKVHLPPEGPETQPGFFRKGNLTALRELALRRTAARVDVQMRDYMAARDITGPWAAGERILVCVSSHPLAERLVRTGRRLAGDLDAPWTVAFVETPGHVRMRPEQQQRLNQTLLLAEQMGAEVVRLTGVNAAETLLAYAHAHNITKLVVGKPRWPRWVEWARGSITQQILRKSGSVDVFIIGETAAEEKSPSMRVFLHSPAWRYAAAAVLVGGVTLLGVPLHGRIEPTNLVMIYLTAVVLAALFLGRGPSMLASLLSVLAFDFFFIRPTLTLSVADTEYLITFAGLLLVGLVISNSAALVREQVEQLRKREAFTAAINALSRDLTGLSDLDEMLRAVIRRIQTDFSRDVVLLLPENNHLKVAAASPRLEKLGEEEMTAALWAFQHNRETGLGTSTLPQAAMRCIPLQTVHGLVGVMGVQPAEAQGLLTADQRHLLESFASLAALAIERARLAQQASQTQVLQSTEKLQAALLHSISHELRTPLVTITGALSSLAEGEAAPALQRELAEAAYGEARRMNILVGNLLDMSRLESGAFRLNRQPSDLWDLAGVALSQFGERHPERQVLTDLAEDAPLLDVDMALMVQVLVNLLDNAAKYSPVQAPIRLLGRLEGEDVILSVADEGVGIPLEDLERVFDKFYRVQTPAGPSGTGLGLAIARGIVEAHGGRIWAQNRPGGGTIISIQLARWAERRVD